MVMGNLILGVFVLLVLGFCGLVWYQLYQDTIARLTWGEVASSCLVGGFFWILTSALYVYAIDRRHAQDAIDVVRVLNGAYTVQQEVNRANETLAHSNDELKAEVTKLRQLLLEQRFALDQAQDTHP